MSRYVYFSIAVILNPIRYYNKDTVIDIHL